MIAIDYEDLASGFAIGRAAALADWRFRREEREGAALIARLVSAAAQRRYRARHPERIREIRKRARAKRLACDPGYESRASAALYAQSAEYRAKALARAKKRNERAKNDPVILESIRHSKRTCQRKRYAKIKEDPAAWAALLARSREYKRRVAAAGRGA